MFWYAAVLVCATVYCDDLSGRKGQQSRMGSSHLKADLVQGASLLCLALPACSHAPPPLPPLLSIVLPRPPNPAAPSQQHATLPCRPCRRLQVKIVSVDEGGSGIKKIRPKSLLDLVKAAGQ